MSDGQESSKRERLPAMTFADGGPPYSEDEDLHSPIVKPSRHRKSKSQPNYERGRSPGDVPYFMRDADDEGEPGGAVEDSDTRRQPPEHRDSNFAKPIQRQKAPYEKADQFSEEESDPDEGDGRFSKDYSFTIASPDEEVSGKAIALFDFQNEHENELPLKEGQIILVSYRHGQGWLVAEDPRTGESGLVPEEFVRLVRDIEGGLNGLSAVGLDDTVEVQSPVSNDPAMTPTPAQQEFAQPTLHHSRPSGEKHPPVQSSFSTSSSDFTPLPGRSEDGQSPNKEGQR